MIGWSNVIVSLNNDSFIEKYKGVKPVMSYKERYDSLSHCQYVDEIIENKYDSDSKRLIEEIMPNIIAIGTDWAGKDYYRQMGFTQEWLDEKEIVLVYLPYGDTGISTTEIKKRIKKCY